MLLLRLSTQPAYRRNATPQIGSFVRQFEIQHPHSATIFFFLMTPIENAYPGQIEVHVHHGLSRVLSTFCLLNCLIILLAALFLTLQVLKVFETQVLHHHVSSPSELFLSLFVSLAAPLSSVAGMGTPILQVIYALRQPNSEIQLQWRLFVAIGVSTALGVVYGFRKSLSSVVISSLLGLSLQVINIAATYNLSSFAKISSRVLFPRIMSCFRLFSVADKCPTLFKWSLFLPLLVTPLAFTIVVAFVLPLDSVLSPLYTVCCLLPYLATFSTFPSDLRSYRVWAAGDAISDQAASPPGVDLKTLWVMQIANLLWASFGFLMEDMPIIVSASASLVAAGSQLCCYLMPALVVSVDVHYWLTSGSQLPVHIIIDCGWPFVSDFSVSRMTAIYKRKLEIDLTNHENRVLSFEHQPAKDASFGQPKYTASPDLLSKSHPPRLCSNISDIELTKSVEN
eukprot:Gregarina_sp_Poly_1__1098@NODE_1269_length_4530_cov_972_447233_g864_i0_p2_GENE_NODE_1269_length_4530_cov_972_447233_g864_i0NODE_1269_length_4530_cov_972_447233_g864_i0_p2_ORF_typecomplete_len453_score40_01MtN3_slv/PF03083_16/2_1e02MtN3_slv/PF03083_16/2_1MtN3_slv/PF03083_16/0_03LapA_dom/PF06305_11/0_47LapA_dom/PF06305_11/4_3e03LapA_dom/PF06305_11/2_7e02_NODE_1269_length_4530_cov_972_447233_g864_i0131371